MNPKKMKIRLSTLWTVTSRALEFLHELCESDATVAETFIELLAIPGKKKDEEVYGGIDMVKPSNTLSLSAYISHVSQRRAT